MSETCRGHLWEKITVKLFASSWYIFLTYIYDARSHLYQIWNFFKTGCQLDFKFLTAPDVVLAVWFIGYLKGDWYHVTVVNPNPLFSTEFNRNFTFLIHECLVPRLTAKRCSALSYNLALRNINCTWNSHIQHQFSSKMIEADDN